MIKKLLLTIIIAFSFMISANALAFEPMIETKNEIDNNRIYITLGYFGEDILAVMNTVQYNEDYITLVDIISDKDFIVTKSNEIDNDGYQMFKILADSNLAYNEHNYATLVFELTSNFENGKSTKIFFQSFESAGTKKVIYNHIGKILTLRKESNEEMTYFINNITKTTDIEIWLENHLLVLAGGIVLAIIAIIIIINIPTKRKKEAVEKKLEQEIKNSKFKDVIKMPKLKKNKNKKETEELYYYNQNTTKNDNEDNDDKNKIEFFIFLFVFIILTSFNVVNAKEYNVDFLRNIIVGNIPKDYQMDYNNDGKIDLLDLIETKDLTNHNFGNSGNKNPDFAEIPGQSNNINPSQPDKTSSSRTTSQTPTKSTTTKNTTTTKKEIGNSGSNTTNKTATTESTKTTTSTKTTSTKTTSTKQAVATYQVTITTTNGSVSENSFNLQANKSKTITLTPKSGYVIDKNNSKCSNVSYSFSSNTRLTLSNPTGNATCNLNFTALSNIKVTLEYYIGKGNSTYTYPTVSYPSNKTLDNGGTGVYNTIWETSLPLPKGYKVKGNPSCGSYSNNVFSIAIPAKSTICRLYFDPILYNLTIYVSGQSTQINSGSYTKIYYGESKDIEFFAYSTYSKISCTDGKSPSLRKISSDGGYVYSFTVNHSTTNNLTCNIS